MLREVPLTLVNNFCYIARNAGVRFTKLFELITDGYGRGPIVDQLSKRIIEICENITVNGILQTLRDAYIADWIDAAYEASNLTADAIQDNLTRDLDQIVDSLYSLLKDVEQQLRTIGFAQQCEVRADLISDMFVVVVRDVAGRMFEMSRQCLKKKNDICVLGTIRALVQNVTALPNYDVQRRLRLLLKPAPGTLLHVLNWFVTVYRQISIIYNLQPVTILDYLIEKQVRNENSHFSNSIGEYAETYPIGNNPIPTTYFTQFVNIYGPAEEVFYRNELNQLHAVLGQLSLQRSQPSSTRFYPNEIVRATILGQEESLLAKIIREVTLGLYLVRWGPNLQNEVHLHANTDIQRLYL